MTTYLQHFHPFPDSNEEIEITLDYTLGGMNYWTYKTDPRGIQLVFNPVRRSPGCKSFTMFDDRGRRFFIEELKRKTASRGKFHADRLTPLLPQLGALAVEQNWAGIRELIA